MGPSLGQGILSDTWKMANMTVSWKTLEESSERLQNNKSFANVCQDFWKNIIQSSLFSFSQ